MNETERDSQLSALFDGELAAEPAELVTRRLLKDPSLRATWGRYALIGAVLRQEPLLQAAGGQGDLADRVRQSLRDEPQLVSPEPARVFAAPPTGSWRRRSLSGGALAATVAAVAVLVMRWQTPSPDLPLAQQAPQTVVPVAAVLPPPVSAAVTDVVVRPVSVPHSYTTPLPGQSGGQHVGSEALVNYVVAHGEFAMPIVRMGQLSTMMSPAGDPAVGAVEMTKAEVGARR